MRRQGGRAGHGEPAAGHHIEVAGSEEAGVAAGSEILTVQALRIEEIGELVRRRIGRAAGVLGVAVGGDLNQSGLISRPPGRVWCPAMAVRRQAGSAPSWRS